jgi:hypothetical protein
MTKTRAIGLKCGHKSGQVGHPCTLPFVKLMQLALDSGGRTGIPALARKRPPARRHGNPFLRQTAVLPSGHTLH